MKQKSFAVLILAAALAAATAKGELTYYAFVSGTVIPLGSGSATYVEKSNIDGIGANTVWSTRANGTLTIGLNNATQGDYLLSLFGTADGYTTACSITVTGVTDTTYSKNFTFTQQDTKPLTDSNSNLNDSDASKIPGQKTLFLLEDLPAGNFTVTFKTINHPSGSSWAHGNYGYFTLGSVSDMTYDVCANSGAVMVFGSSRTAKPYLYMRGKRGVGTVIETSNSTFGSTSNYDVFNFALSVTASSSYILSYDAGSTLGTSDLIWTLCNNVGTVVATAEKTIQKTSDWFGDDKQNYTVDFGSLEAGLYTLTARMSSSLREGGCGNFGNITLTSYMTLPTSSTINLATAKSNGSLVLKGSGGIKISSAGLIDSTKQNDDTFTFYLYSPTESAYRFSYKGGTHTATVAWTLDGKEIATNAFTGTGSTPCNDQRTHNLGAFESGSFHALVGKVKKASDTNAWGGNYGYFQFIEAATTTVDSATVYVEKSWLTTEYGSGTTTIPEGFSTIQSGKAISGAEAYALGYNSIPATGEVVVSPSITGTTMTFGFKDADADAAAARGATVTYKLLTGAAANSLNEGDSSTALPTLDLATVDSVKYIKLEADVSWTTAN